MGKLPPPIPSDARPTVRWGNEGPTEIMNTPPPAVEKLRRMATLAGNRRRRVAQGTSPLTHRRPTFDAESTLSYPVDMDVRQTFESLDETLPAAELEADADSTALFRKQPVSISQRLPLSADGKGHRPSDSMCTLVDETHPGLDIPTGVGFPSDPYEDTAYSTDGQIEVVKPASRPATADRQVQVSFESLLDAAVADDKPAVSTARPENFSSTRGTGVVAESRRNQAQLGLREVASWLFGAAAIVGAMGLLNGLLIEWVPNVLPVAVTAGLLTCFLSWAVCRRGSMAPLMAFLLTGALGHVHLALPSAVLAVVPLAMAGALLCVLAGSLMEPRSRAAGA